MIEDACSHPALRALEDAEHEGGYDFGCTGCNTRWALADVPEHLKGTYIQRPPEAGLRGKLLQGEPQPEADGSPPSPAGAPAAAPPDMGQARLQGA